MNNMMRLDSLLEEPANKNINPTSLVSPGSELASTAAVTNTAQTSTQQKHKSNALPYLDKL